MATATTRAKRGVIDSRPNNASQAHLRCTAGVLPSSVHHYEVITCKSVSLCKAHGCCCPAAVTLQVKQSTPCQHQRSAAAHHCHARLLVLLLGRRSLQLCRGQAYTPCTAVPIQGLSARTRTQHPNLLASTALTTTMVSGPQPSSCFMKGIQTFSRAYNGSAAVMQVVNSNKRLCADDARTQFGQAA